MNNNPYSRNQYGNNYHHNYPQQNYQHQYNTYNNNHNNNYNKYDPSSYNQKKWNQKKDQRRQILFYKEYEKYGEFSNFFASEFILDDLSWKTSEHYYQANKYKKGSQKYSLIRTLLTPLQAFTIGRLKEDQFTIRKDWEKVKDDVMYDCCKAKFSQNDKLKDLLISTQDYELVEDSKRDSYWGIGAYGEGKNKLGKILMEIRQEFLIQQQEKKGHYQGKSKSNSPKLKNQNHYLSDKTSDISEISDKSNHSPPNLKHANDVNLIDFDAESDKDQKTVPNPMEVEDEQTKQPKFNSKL